MTNQREVFVNIYYPYITYWDSFEDIIELLNNLNETFKKLIETESIYNNLINDVKLEQGEQVEETKLEKNKYENILMKSLVCLNYNTFKLYIIQQ